MAIILRNYKPTDHSSLKENLKQAGMYEEDMDGKKLLERMTSKDFESIIIAEEKETIVGSAYFIDLGFIAMLWRLNVIPSHQKQGIGEKLINEVKKRAKERGFTQLHFMVNESKEPLVKWYKKLGAWSANPFRWMGFDL